MDKSTVFMAPAWDLNEGARLNGSKTNESSISLSYAIRLPF